MIRVVLVDDNDKARTAIRRLLDDAEGIQVVGEAENGVACLAVVQDLKPDVVIMDVLMPEMDGLEATERLQALAGRQPHVVICSTYATGGLVEEAFAKGAAGYLVKLAAPVELPGAIVAVHQGERFLSAAISHLAPR
jgi:DNA-binding NarL/FixJ family response regulator